MHNDEDDLESFPIAYSIDNAILMHRDVHFGGNFALMLDYYAKEGKGVSKDFDLSRIQELYQVEQQAGKDLSPLLLSGAEAEMVAEGRQAYQQLRELYNVRQAKSLIPRLIADLILAEDDEAQKAIAAVVEQKGVIVPALIDLLRNENFYNPLFPGYGQAPMLAAECLGLIGDKRAIISLFEAIGEGDFFNEDLILDALYTVGAPAKAFLLKVVHGKPITLDNEQAAIALIRFKMDPEVSLACLQLLYEIDAKQHPALATYLVLACEGLPPERQAEFLALAKQEGMPKSIGLDIAAVAKAWAQTM